MRLSRGPIGIEVYRVMLNKRGRREIHVELGTRDQREDCIQRHLGDLGEKRRHAETRRAAHVVEDALGGLVIDLRSRTVLIQKNEIANRLRGHLS